MRDYETVGVLKPDLPAEAVMKVVNRVRDILGSEGGRLVKVSQWGKKRLAYDIKKNQKGIFLHFLFVAKPGTIKELARNLRLMDEVMRFQTMILAEATAQPQAGAEEEPILEGFEPKVAPEEAPQEAAAGEESAEEHSAGGEAAAEEAGEKGEEGEPAAGGDRKEEQN